MSSHNADAAFPPTDQRPGGRVAATVYINRGRPRVTLEQGNSRIDLSWGEWGDLVAEAGERFVALCLTRPDVLEAVRQAAAAAAALGQVGNNNGRGPP